jgi:hypothetical protein
MGEKLYRVKLKSGHHLVSSKGNPELKRGTSRDSNNKNPDIPEFEEVDIDDYVDSSRNPYSDFEQHSSQPEERTLSPLEEELARILAEAIVNAVVEGTEELLQSKVLPWWANTALPALRQQSVRIKTKLGLGMRGLKSRKKRSLVKANTNESELVDPNVGTKSLTNQIVSDDSYIQMMLMAARARRVGMEKISQENLSDEAMTARLSQFDALLSRQVCLELNRILSSPQLRLQESTASTILSATGGGIKVAGVYQPVDEIKVQSALQRYSKLPENQLDYIRSLHTSTADGPTNSSSQTSES